MPSMRRILVVLVMLATPLGLWAQSGVGGGGQSNVSGGGSSSASPRNSVDPTNPAFAGGIKGDVKVGTDFTFSNTLTTITSTAQVTFSSADIGKVIFGTNCGPVTGQFTANVQVPTGTIVSVNGHSATVSIAATASNAGAGCAFWGTNDTAAWQAVQSTAQTIVRGCLDIYMPAMISFTTVGLFNTEPTSCNPTLASDGVDYGMSIEGRGQATSIIMPLPVSTATGMTGSTGPFFDPTTCNGGPTNQGCFFSAFSATVNNIGLWGGGVSNTGLGSLKFAVAGNTGAQFTNFACAAWGGSDLNFVGISSTSSRFTMLSVDGCGNVGFTEANSTANLSYIYYGFLGDNLSFNFQVPTGQELYAYGLQIGIVRTGNCVSGSMATINGKFHSYGTQVFFGTGTTPGGITAGLNVDTGGIAYLDGDEWNFPTSCAAGSGLFMHNGGQVRSVNSEFTGGTTNGGIIRQDTAQFHDVGGNRVITNFSASLAPALTTSGNGTIATFGNGNENEHTNFTLTAGTTSGATPTVTATFAGAMSGATGAAPNCSLTFLNGTVDGVTFTGTWNARATAMQTAGSTSLVTFTLDNNAVALTSTQTYGGKISCKEQ